MPLSREVYVQLKLNIYRGCHGGRRPGSGRKRVHSKGVAHRTREKVIARTPVHINFKYRTLIKNKFCLKILKRAIANARAHGLKVIHFSLQSNHVHLIIEAENNQLLTMGMRSLCITFAKGLNQGKVQLERYHLHVLKTIQETRNAIQYVLFNQQHHEKGIYSKIDEYSSILLMAEGLKLIKNYCRTKKILITIRKVEPWNLDLGASYLARIALSRLLEI